MDGEERERSSEVGKEGDEELIGYRKSTKGKNWGGRKEVKKMR